MKQYIISVLAAIIFAIPALAQQNRTVTGVVLDEKSQPIIGASIIVPGVTMGAVTNLDGKFTLKNIPEGQKIIQVSYIGYIQQKIDVTNKKDLIVKMEPSNSELNEVVVVGYGVQKKAHMTGSIATISPKEISDLSGSNLGTMLRGTMTGVSVSGGEGRPGEQAAISVRQSAVSGAYTNISGFVPDTSPLYVIDDFVTSATVFNNLDPTMIESISVLKDGAAAVYGARSAQGVVLVRTKRGKEGPVKINYSGQFGYTDEISRAKMLDSYNYGKIWNAVRAANPNDPWNARTELFQADELNTMKSLNYDLLEQEWRAAMTQKHSINISGGSGNANYFAGISYFNQDGNLGKIDYDRWNYRAGLDAKIGKWIKTSLQVSGDYGKQNTAYSKIGGSTGDNDYNYLLTRPRYMPAFVNGLPIASYGISNVIYDQSQYYNYSVIQNMGNYSRNSTQNMAINSSIEYDMGIIDLLKGLKFKVTFSKSIANSKTNQFASNYTAYQIINRAGSGQHLYNGDDLNLSSTNFGTIPVTNGNSLRRYMSRGDNYQLNFISTYNRSFGKHDIGGLFSIERIEAETEDLTGEVLDPYSFTNGQSNGANGTQTTSFTRTESGMLSYIGRINYAYDSKYLAEIMMRSDASTKLAPENYWSYFPSLSLGWVTSEESWFHNILPKIDYLKLRGSMGLLGNDNTKAWLWMQTYGLNKDKGPIFGVNPGISSGSHINLPDNSVNRDAKWSKSYKSNFGFDLNVLKNRLTFNTDAYYEWNRDVFMSRQGSAGWASTVGAQPAPENFGSYNAYGIELAIGWKDKIGKDFKYFIKVNTGYSDNKILIRGWESLIPIDKNHPGQRSDVGDWGYECIGMFKNYQQIEEYFKKNNIVNYMGLAKGDVHPGMLIYNNVRGSQKADGSYYGPNDPNDPKAGFVNEDDKVRISARNNPWGFTTNFGAEYKGFSISAQVSANWGGYTFLPSDARGISSLVSTASGYNVMEYTNLPSFWANNMYVYKDVLDNNGNVVAEQNRDAKYPNLRFALNREQSTFWKVSATQITIRNITMAYAIPTNIVKAMNVESCRFNLTVQNVASLYNPYPDNFIDPLQGTYGRYPTLRRITLGVNVSF